MATNEAGAADSGWLLRGAIEIITAHSACSMYCNRSCLFAAFVSAIVFAFLSFVIWFLHTEPYSPVMVEQIQQQD